MIIIEAIRAYIVSLGVTEAADWPREQVMSHVDNVLLSEIRENGPESVHQVIDEIIGGVKNNAHGIMQAILDTP